jgi:hypothetical protein
MHISSTTARIMPVTAPVRTRFTGPVAHPATALAPLGGLIDRRGRVLGGPAARAAFGGSQNPPLLPLRVMRLSVVLLGVNGRSNQASAGFAGHSRSSWAAARRIIAASTRICVSRTPSAGHSTTKANGPSGGSGHTQ